MTKEKPGALGRWARGVGLGILILLASMVAGVAQTTSQQTAPSTPADTPTPVYNSTQFDLESKIVGRTFRILVSVPVKPAPPSGYPLFLHLDGPLFPMVATEANLVELGGGKGALVVGIGYTSPGPTPDWMKWRSRDLTPETELKNVPPIPGLPEPKADNYGGAEAFYRFITEELRPALAARYKIDATDQMLYGHSFGGLFALHVMFRHSEAFQTYLISSPSIWWNNSSVLKDEPGFVAKVKAGTIAPRVFIVVGGEEQDVPKTAPPGMTLENVAKMIREDRMVDNARELAERLAKVEGQPRYTVKFHAFEDEDHLSVIPPSVMRSLNFALRP